MSDREPITEKQIRELLQEGKLPNLFRWWHYKQVTACAIAIDETLDRLVRLGYTGYEVYYALRQHYFYTAFSLEDSGMEKGMAQINKEMDADLYEHRKKYTVEAMRSGKYGHPTRPKDSSEPAQP